MGPDIVDADDSSSLSGREKMRGQRAEQALPGRHGFAVEFPEEGFARRADEQRKAETAQLAQTAQRLEALRVADDLTGRVP